MTCDSKACKNARELDFDGFDIYSSLHLSPSVKSLGFGFVRFVPGLRLFDESMNLANITSLEFRWTNIPPTIREEISACVNLQELNISVDSSNHLDFSHLHFPQLKTFTLEKNSSFPLAMWTTFLKNHLPTLAHLQIPGIYPELLPMIEGQTYSLNHLKVRDQ